MKNTIYISHDTPEDSISIIQNVIKTLGKESVIEEADARVSITFETDDEKTKYFFTSSFNVFPTDLNHGNTLFGGKMLAEIDCEAAKVARAVIHGTEADGAVTASFEKINFINPAHQGDLVIMEADVIRLGTTSIKIKIDAFVWNGPYKKDWKTICTAETTFVALKDGKPFPHGKSFRNEN